jgi:hypothetical protein
MQSSNRHNSFFLTLIGFTVTAFVYLISGWKRVASVMHEGTTTFSIAYMVIVFLGLFFLLDYLERVQLWRATLAGIIVGYFAGFVSYFIAVLSMPDGAERLMNSASMMGWTWILLDLWIPIVLLCWTWSALGFLIVSGMSKP